MKTLPHIALLIMAAFSMQASAQSTPPSRKNDKPSAFAGLDNVLNYIEKEYPRNKFENIAIKNGVIHIFLDDEGNLLYTDFPTTARNGDKFQFHVFSRENYTYSCQFSGTYVTQPLSQEIGTPNEFVKDEAEKNKVAVYTEFTSPISSPRTGKIDIKLTRYKNDKEPTVLVDRSIDLLKVNRVSINTGIVCSFLHRPENIAVATKPNGDTTLVADYKDVKGFLALMLTFHLKRRNLDVPTRDWMERIGFTVGTNLSGTTVADNYFFGLNFEIVNGLFLNGGAHFGKKNYVVNYENFHFEEDKFSGPLQTRTKWDVAPYLCVSVDAALFAKVFRNLLSASANN